MRNYLAQKLTRDNFQSSEFLGLQMDSMSSRFEERLVELHSVIAELSRQMEDKSREKIPEEDDNADDDDDDDVTSRRKNGDNDDDDDVRSPRKDNLDSHEVASRTSTDIDAQAVEVKSFRQGVGVRVKP